MEEKQCLKKKKKQKKPHVFTMRKENILAKLKH